MFHDAKTIRIDGGIQSDLAKPESGVLRRLIDNVYAALTTKPSEAETAAQREYQRLIDEAWKKINRTTPAHIRQLSDDCRARCWAPDQI